MNSLIAHNKTSLLAADTSTQRYDIICLSETYLDSSVPHDTDGLPRKGYYQVRADHPGKIISGGVFIYFKKDLVLLALDVSFFPESLLCEFPIGGKRGYVTVTYCIALIASQTLNLVTIYLFLTS